MANALYPLWKEALISGATNATLNGTVNVILIDSADYTYSAAHQYLSDVPSAARIATATLGTKTYTTGVFDAADVTFTSVTGDQSEALIIYIDTGTATTSRLVAFLDTGITGMPVTPNSGNINVVWDNGANRVFGL